ncbi:MarR family transcriptional regulator [Saccharopolyspora indica]|uniref:MarR family winged helix-turn-helix transcriptional regulator n=1 Tax=Saccharopolyspora indica TaxID=1229659 RepID=UPI0022EA7149|nr:MarR family transcriptional regulator [Saccharopolyspora indica]MDA3643981.1 MarR family transcriptional regulator [Saccharopolyspora indica]
MTGSTVAELDDGGFDAWLGVWKAHTLVIREVERALRSAGAPSVPACEVLSRLAAAPDGRLQMHELARRCFVSKSGISQLVTQLSKQGLVERQSDPDDLRTTYAALTDQGEQALSTYGPVFLRAVRENFSRHLGGDDAAALSRITARLITGHGEALETGEAPGTRPKALRDIVTGGTDPAG